jgi:threonine aldolase
MNFVSDNTAGVTPEVLAALARVNDGRAGNYGSDHVTKRLTEVLSGLFEREVAVFPVGTGTAANSLTLATLTPHYGAVLCHEGAHIYEDECGAPEFFSGGAKLVPIAGAHGKLTPDAVEQMLARFHRGDVHHVQPAVVSLTQATERGTTYSPSEVAAIARVAKTRDMAVHIDGARFANALAFLKCTPAELTWKAGVDAMSFGVTKDGALAAEAAIFFDPTRAADFEYRRKRGGHLFSKMRFFSAQIEAMIEDGLWLRLAAHANAMAARLAAGIAGLPGFALEHPVEANEVFARLPSKAAMQALLAAGAKFYPWGPMSERPLVRLVCAFATRETEVDEFLVAAKRVA